MRGSEWNVCEPPFPTLTACRNPISAATDHPRAFPLPWLFRINVEIFKLSIKWTTGMICDSNDTTLTSCGLACFENTHDKQSTYFGQNSWFPHVCQVNVPIFKLSVKWTPGDVLRFQRHNHHIMSSRLLREHSYQTKHLFWAKIMISPCVSAKRANF